MCPLVDGLLPLLKALSPLLRLEQQTLCFRAQFAVSSGEEALNRDSPERAEEQRLDEVLRGEDVWPRILIRQDVDKRGETKIEDVDGLRMTQSASD